MHYPDVVPQRVKAQQGSKDVDWVPAAHAVLLLQLWGEMWSSVSRWEPWEYIGLWAQSGQGGLLPNPISSTVGSQWVSVGWTKEHADPTQPILYWDSCHPSPSFLGWWRLCYLKAFILQSLVMGGMTPMWPPEISQSLVWKPILCCLTLWHIGTDAFYHLWKKKCKWLQKLFL